MKQDLLIVGPIGDIGGRELETGFIANTLSEDYNITICSTANYTSKSQIFDFISKEQVIQLNQLIFKQNLKFKVLAIFSYLKSFRKGSILDFVSNSLSKKMGYGNYAVNQIKKEIDKNDAIIICAQISSNYIKDVVEYSNYKKKPVIFRTSNTIKESDTNQKEWLKNVTLFIHHSSSNAERLQFLDTHNYQLIDQCTFKEEKMLKIQPTSKFNSLLFIGRLSSEKGISELVGFFKNNNTNIGLKIIGDGPLFEELNEQCEQLKNVHLLGFLDQDEIIDYIKESDAIIIPSYEESGPLVGLEAMASARLVISTKVGAMTDRLEGCKNQFWFNNQDWSTLEKVIDGIRNLGSDNIKSIAIENRKRYQEKYTTNLIKNRYKNIIFNL